jgi:hypothetical protein
MSLDQLSLYVHLQICIFDLLFSVESGSVGTMISRLSWDWDEIKIFLNKSLYNKCYENPNEGH